MSQIKAHVCMFIIVRFRMEGIQFYLHVRELFNGLESTTNTSLLYVVAIEMTWAFPSGFVLL